MLAPLKSSGTWRSALALASIALLCLVGMSYLMPLELIADETYHLLQVMLFLAHQFYLGPSLSVPPGYHALVATISALLDIHFLSGFRIIHALLSLSCLGLTWWYWLRTAPSFPLIQSLQLLATPLLWPFYWTMYADLTSVAILLTGLLCVLERRYRWAAAIGLLSLLFRQHNVFWLGFYWALALAQEGFWHNLMLWLRSPAQKRAGLAHLFSPGARTTIVFAIPLAAFIVFIILNNGIAVGDRSNQTFGGLYPLQLFGFFLVLWILLLPLHIANLPKIVHLLLRQPAWIPVLCILFLIFITTFSITHPHNFRSDYFLRNWFLYHLKDMFKYQVYAFVGITWALLSLAVTPFRERAQYWLYPITALALLPVWLIEQRYYIMPFVLFMLFRIPGPRWLEISLLAWSILLSIPLTFGFTSMKVFI